MLLDDVKTIPQLMEALRGPRRVRVRMEVRQIVAGTLGSILGGARAEFYIDDVTQQALANLVKHQRASTAETKDHAGSIKALIRTAARNLLYDSQKRDATRERNKETLSARLSAVQGTKERAELLIQVVSLDAFDEMVYLIERNIDKFSQEPKVNHLHIERLRQLLRLAAGQVSKAELPKEIEGFTDRRFQREASAARNAFVWFLAKEYEVEFVEAIGGWLGGREMSVERRVELQLLHDGQQKAFVEVPLDDLWDALAGSFDRIELTDVRIPGIEKLEAWPSAGVLLLRGVQGELETTGEVSRDAQDVLMRGRTGPARVHLIDFSVVLSINEGSLEIEYLEPSEDELAEPPSLSELLVALDIEPEIYRLFQSRFETDDVIGRWITAADVARFGPYCEAVPGTSSGPLPGTVLFAALQVLPESGIERFQAALRRRAVQLMNRLTAPPPQVAQEREAIESLRLLIRWAKDEQTPAPDEETTQLDRKGRQMGITVTSEDVLIRMAADMRLPDEEQPWWLPTS